MSIFTDELPDWVLNPGDGEGAKFADDGSILPPWLAHPEIKDHSIGWRMGNGEWYKDMWTTYIRSLSEEEKKEYAEKYLRPEGIYWCRAYK